jgi:predicted small lipoprotein YifL
MAALTGSLAACGQTGPLYLPAKPAPAAIPAASTAPAPVSSPATPPAQPSGTSADAPVPVSK